MVVGSLGENRGRDRSLTRQSVADIEDVLSVAGAQGRGDDDVVESDDDGLFCVGIRDSCLPLLLHAAVDYGWFTFNG